MRPHPEHAPPPAPVPHASTARPARSAAWSTRLGMIALELAILGAVWWLLPLPRALVGAIAAVIVVAGLVPVRFAGIASGIGVLGLAALLRMHFGADVRLVAVVALFGIVFLIGGIASWRSARSPRD